jgi:CO/xanthine dehydrogenase Mo-binding subunit
VLVACGGDRNAVEDAVGADIYDLPITAEKSLRRFRRME